MRDALDDGRVAFRRAATTPAAGRAGQRGDSSIRAEILDEIAHAPWLDLGGISVAVRRGEVLFEGEIPERRLRIALREIAGRCRGVRAVHDRLRVVRGSGPL